MSRNSVMTVHVRRGLVFHVVITVVLIEMLRFFLVENLRAMMEKRGEPVETSASIRPLNSVPERCRCSFDSREVRCIRCT